MDYYVESMHIWMTFGGRAKSMSLGGGGEGLVRRVTSEIYCSSTDIGWRDFENHCSVSDTIFAQLLNNLVLGGMAFLLRGFLLFKCANPRLFILIKSADSIPSLIHYISKGPAVSQPQASCQIFLGEGLHRDFASSRVNLAWVC